MLDDFLDNAKLIQNASLIKTEAAFVANRRQWLDKFCLHFREMCSRIVKMQSESALHTISHLEYTMLYSNFINRRYVAEVWVYGEGWYLDKEQRMIGEYDISFLFTHFDDLWNQLLVQRKRYVGKVSSNDIKLFMIEALPKFYSYLINIARFAIVDCVDEKPFTDIARNDEFWVGAGDYMAKTEHIYAQKINKNADELAVWFSEKARNEYNFEDCADLDFSSRDFSNTVFRYVQFRRSLFANANLQSCSLIGTNFSHARLDNCNLENTAIYEADFSHSCMKYARLIFTRGAAGMYDENEWTQAGFLPVKFCNADLTGADIRGADLKEADFSGANLSGADFSGANLPGALFIGADLSNAKFSSANLTGANFTGAVRNGALFDGAKLDGAIFDKNTGRGR